MAENIFDNPYSQYFIDAGQKYDVDPNLLMAQAYQESRFDPNAVSPAGAQGISQAMPKTAQEYGLSDPFDPKQSIDFQARYMKELLNRYGGDRDKALAAYNAGMGRVDKANGIPNIQETQDYVRRISEYLGSNTNKPQNVSAAVDLSQFTRPEEKKLTGAQKIAAIMGALSSIGGLVANTTAAFRRVPGDVGGAAIKTGNSLLESLLADQATGKDSMKLFDSVINSKLPDDQKANILSFVSQGMNKEATALLKDAFATENDINRAVKVATDPRIIQANQAKKEDEASQAIRIAKAKSELEDAAINNQKKQLIELSSIQNPTEEQKITKALLQKKLGLKNGSEDMSASEVIARTKLVDDIKKEVSSVQTIVTGLGIMEDSLKNVPAGYFSGNISKGLNYVLGTNPEIDRYNSAKNLITGLTSNISGQKGALSDRDIKQIVDALPRPDQTEAQRKASLSTIISILKEKVGAYKTTVGAKVYGKDYVPLVDELTSFDRFAEQNNKEESKEQPVQQTPGVDLNQVQKELGIKIIER